MVNRETFEQLLPSAYEWAQAQEVLILARGLPLDQRGLADALSAGVKDSSRVRVLVVDRISLPENPALAEASRGAQIITDASRSVTLGHGIIMRADCWGDREMLAHQLVHVAQYERSGSLDAFVRQYLCDRRDSANFTKGSLEEEACRVARQICAS